MRLLKDIVKAIINDYDNPIVNIKWGERQDLNKMAKHIFDFVTNVKD